MPRTCQQFEFGPDCHVSSDILVKIISDKSMTNGLYSVQISLINHIQSLPVVSEQNEFLLSCIYPPGAGTFSTGYFSLGKIAI